MTSPFVTTAPATFGGTETFLDRVAFGKALAEKLGATLVVNQDDSPNMPRYWAVSLHFDGWQMRITDLAYKGKVGRAWLNACPISGDSPGKPIDWPNAEVDSGRDMQALVNDIRRRIVTPAEDCETQLATQRGEALRVKAEAAADAERLRMLFPSLHVSLDGDTVRISGGTSGAYILARMNAGRLYIERAGSFDAATSENVLRAMIGGAG